MKLEEIITALNRFDPNSDGYNKMLEGVSGVIGKFLHHTELNEQKKRNIESLMASDKVTYFKTPSGVVYIRIRNPDNQHIDPTKDEFEIAGRLKEGGVLSNVAEIRIEADEGKFVVSRLYKCDSFQEDKALYSALIKNAIEGTQSECDEAEYFARVQRCEDNEHGAHGRMVWYKNLHTYTGEANNHLNWKEHLEKFVEMFAPKIENGKLAIERNRDGFFKRYTPEFVGDRSSVAFKTMLQLGIVKIQNDDSVKVVDPDVRRRIDSFINRKPIYNLNEIPLGKIEIFPGGVLLDKACAGIVNLANSSAAAKESGKE